MTTKRLQISRLVRTMDLRNNAYSFFEKEIKPKYKEIEKGEVLYGVTCKPRPIKTF